MSQAPIQIHIPPQLHHHAVPLSKFLDQNQKYNTLAIGALIFSPGHLSSPAGPRLLLVQRATTERAFANLWEIPGGAAELSDPTILHSVAREVFEETGLRLTRFVRQIGDGEEFRVSPKEKPKRCLKLSFEIHVEEIGNPLLAGLQQPASLDLEHSDEHSAKPVLESLKNVSVVLDPEEHQAFQWVTEEEVKNAICFLQLGEDSFARNMAEIAQMEGDLKLVSEDLRQMLLKAFALHNADIKRLGRDMGAV
ncbi:hypothetical protein MMC30_002201 [Trapelia coarctata]|nr:hypothetical protein [Trapelia coarctata]